MIFLKSNGYLLLWLGFDSLTSAHLNFCSCGLICGCSNICCKSLLTIGFSNSMILEKSNGYLLFDVCFLIGSTNLIGNVICVVFG
jgi:hypothetical protein